MQVWQNVEHYKQANTHQIRIMVRKGFQPKFLRAWKLWKAKEIHTSSLWRHLNVGSSSFDIFRVHWCTFAVWTEWWASFKTQIHLKIRQCSSILILDHCSFNHHYMVISLGRELWTQRELNGIRHALNESEIRLGSIWKQAYEKRNWLGHWLQLDWVQISRCYRHRRYIQGIHLLV